MNTPVNFKIATSLKEKGFDEKVKGRYCIKNITPFKIGLFYLSDYELSNEFIYGPTIAEVVMWLYEKHGIWVTVGVDSLFYKGKHNVLIYKNIGYGLELSSIENNLHGPYNSPTEAYEAAIEYTLNNLIK